MFDKDIEVEEDQISEEEWAQLMARAQHRDPVPPPHHNEKRHKKAAVPDHPSQYLNRLQLSSISKLETFGWQLFFIRRPNPNETLTVMHLPSSGETAVIEKDGTVNRAHGVIVRAGE